MTNSDLHIEMTESDDYRFGWESAERGEPSPNWKPITLEQRTKLRAQQLGWDDYHAEQVRP